MINELSEGKGSGELKRGNNKVVATKAEVSEVERMSKN